MAAGVHRALKVIAFNANGIWRWCYEFSKQLQNLHIDVALLSETHLEPHERFFIPNYHSYLLTAPWEEKAFPITVQTYAICAIHLLDKGKTFS
jgi:hypothetical protein